MTINGDWALAESVKALGDKLGVAAIPRAEGRSVTSSRLGYSLIFPGESLKGAHAKTLRKIAAAFQSIDVQSRWQNEGFRVPVNQKVPAPTQPVLQESLKLAREASPLPADPRLPYLWKAIRRGLEDLIKGHKTPAQSAQSMQAWMDGALRKEGR